jgi:hypothetical protein
VLLSRWPQFLVGGAALGLLLTVILVGWFGGQVGSRNAAITVVWIGWWGALVLLLLPLAGRGWCSICPLPLPGEWTQRQALVGVNPRALGGRGRPWPRGLRNLWLQNAAFLALGLFSVPILTIPAASAWALVLLLLLGLVVGALFERRAFCRYVCPLGGFIGLYSLAAPLSLRVIDREVCREHPSKECVRGSSSGYGCPWMVYPATLQRNSDCGLCLECLRTCPLDNVGLFMHKPVLPPAPRGRPPLRPDEVAKSFILVGAGLSYMAVFLGPWQGLKAAAAQVGSRAWALYALGFLLLNLLLLPGLYRLAIWLGSGLSKARTQGRRVLAQAGRSLIPLGMALWIAFALTLVLTNGSYVLATLNDPMGLGWDLMGWEGAWHPLFSAALPWLQAGILLLGLRFSVCALFADQDGGKAPLALAPVAGVHAALVISALAVLL